MTTTTQLMPGPLTKRRRATRRIAAAVAFAASAWFMVPAFAAAEAPSAPPPPATAPTATPTSAHPLTATDVEAFLDGMMPTALRTAETPGAVVVVVKDGQVLFEKGYGFSDYARQIPVDPQRTLFRPGSVSKLFTWTAVMQLVQAGKIDLDADVNQYLDFKIPRYRGLPVTMRQLMTHRAGFSETARDLLTFGKAPPPLDQVLKRYVPPRIFAPDQGPGYSNYGASLAGYIVQRVSGEPFEQYVQRHIFGPLDMTRSTFVQPLPAALAPDMSNGYATRDKPGPGFEIISMPPAGSLSSTGDDMAHFMIAHLQLGRYRAGQILSPQTAQAMHTTVWRSFPDLNGNLLGFYQHNINGHRVIAHGGDTDFFHSELNLFIDDNVGVFVSVNGRGKDGMGEFIRNSLFDGFADRYFPRAQPLPAATVTAATAKKHAAMIAGRYGNTRRSDSTFLNLVSFLMPTVVTANADGTISTAAIGQKETFTEIAPFFWRQINGHDRLQATVVNGVVTRWSTDSAAPIFVFVRASGLAGSGAELPLAIAALAFLVLVAVLWPVTAAVRWRYRAQYPHAGSRALAYRLVRICSVLGVGAVVLWTVVLQQVSSTNGAPVATLLSVAQILAFVAFVGGMVAALWNLVLVFQASGGWTAKLFAVLLTAAFAYMLYIALAYHLIGFSGQY
jgi:CubicO group peptidase (beta-lactamase class C family)